MNRAHAKWSLITPVALGLMIPVIGTAYLGCKKDEPPPPLPSAAPATTPSAPLQLAPEEAVVDAAVEADAAKKPTGPYKPAASLSACCGALSQNAASAPDPTTKMYMMQAAAMCSAAVASGKDKSSIIAIVAGALRGAGMPGACR